MTELYSEWRDFYAKRLSSWMSLEELRAECGKLLTVDNPSPELLLIHAMHALEEREEEREQRHKALLRLAEEHINAITPEWYSAGQRVLAEIRAALRERLGEGE